MAGPSSSVQQTHSHSTSTVIHELAHDEHVEPNAYEKQPPKKGKRRAGECADLESPSPKIDKRR